MKTIEKPVQVYQYDELDDAAKEKAREWYTSDYYPHDDWYDCIDDYFNETVASLEGFTMQKFSFSGFCSQGDGACMTEFDVDLNKFIDANFKGHKASRLKTIVKVFDVGVSTYRHRGYSRYDSVGIDLDGGRYGYKHVESLIDELQDTLEDVFNDLNHKLYRMLEKEYESHFEEETVAENIRCNEYEFTADGRRY